MSKLYTSARKMMYVALARVNAFVPFFKTKLFILCYHSISSDGWAFAVKPEEFKKQITYLSKHFAFITLSDLGDYIAGKKIISKPSVVITFDDGYKDVMQIVPFLKSKKIQPTMFLLSDTLHANRKELATERPFLSKKEIQTLLQNGWEIGSHSATHSNMNTLNEKEIVKEIVTSKKSLEKQFHRPISYIAYPKGKYNEKILSAVKKAGYILGFSMDDGIIDRKIDIYRVPRIGVDGTHSFAEFTTLFLPFNIQARKLLKLFL